MQHILRARPRMKKLENTGQLQCCPVFFSLDHRSIPMQINTDAGNVWQNVGNYEACAWPDTNHFWGYGDDELYGHDWSAVKDGGNVNWFDGIHGVNAVLNDRGPCHV